MPPKAKTKTDDDTQTHEPGELCGECFPNGWGDNDTAMCVHGEWTRE